MYDLRETLLIIPRSCDEAEPVARFIIQDEAKTAGIMLDVLEIRAARQDLDEADAERDVDKDPVLVVRYTYNTAASISREVVESIDASLKAMPQGTRMASIPTILPAVNLLHELLRKSTKRLNKSYLDQAQKSTCRWQGWHIGVIQPVHKAKVRPTKTEEPCLNLALSTKTEEPCRRNLMQRRPAHSARWPIIATQNARWLTGTV